MHLFLQAGGWGARGEERLAARWGVIERGAWAFLLTGGHPRHSAWVEPSGEGGGPKALPGQCGSKQQHKVQTNTGRTSSFDVYRFWVQGKAAR